MLKSIITFLYIFAVHIVYNDLEKWLHVHITTFSVSLLSFSQVEIICLSSCYDLNVCDYFYKGFGPFKLINTS